MDYFSTILGGGENHWLSISYRYEYTQFPEISKKKDELKERNHENGKIDETVIQQTLFLHEIKSLSYMHKHTNAAKTIKSGMILLRMFCSLKPKMP